MKANHNGITDERFLEAVLSIFQRYKMKANHNPYLLFIFKLDGAFNISKIQDESKSQHYLQIVDSCTGAFNISKIQDESKSQPIEWSIPKFIWCFQYFKDTR